MPLYEGRHNVTNVISVDETIQKSIVCGTDKTIKKIMEETAKSLKSGKSVAIDGWYGVDYKTLTKDIDKELQKKDIKAKFVSTNTLALSLEDIVKYKKKFITNDPCFGYVNMKGRISDLMDKNKITALKEEILSGQMIVFGCGAAIPELFDAYDTVFYCDVAPKPNLPFLKPAYKVVRN